MNLNLEQPRMGPMSHLNLLGMSRTVHFGTKEFGVRIPFLVELRSYESWTHAQHIMRSHGPTSLWPPCVGTTHPAVFAAFEKVFDRVDRMVAGGSKLAQRCGRLLK